MSTVVYNNVGLIRCDVQAYQREPVYHGPDYQYTTHRITVRGVYNPEINAYSFSNGPAAYQLPAENLQNPANAVFVLRAVPGARRLANIAANGIMANSISPVGSPLMAEGTGAPVTDQAIRHALMQPRQQLFFAVGNVPSLVSPSVNQDGTIADTDAANGPVPLAVDVVQISGTKTFIVDFSIETSVNESFLFADTASILLSHRWTRTESIDQDMYSTITTEGVARFRTDRLLFTNTIPDDFRFYFFHPVPPRMQRIDWQIEPSEDGSAVAYRLVDRLTYLHIIPGGVTRIEAFQTVGGTYLPPVRLAGRFLETLLGRVNSASTASGLAGLFAAVNSQLPMTEIDLTIRVWGNPATNRKILESTAIRILGVRLTAALTGLFGAPGGIRIFGVNIPGSKNRRSAADELAGTGLEITHDLMGSYVEVSGSWSVPIPPQTFNPVTGATTIFLPDMRGAFPIPGAVGGDDSIGGGALLPRDDNPRQDLFDAARSFVRADGIRIGTRAGVIRQLTAAALGVPDTAPPIAPDPPNSPAPDLLDEVPLPP